VNPAITRNLPEVEAKIASLVGPENVQAILDRLACDLESVDEFEAELSLSLRVDTLCKQYKPSEFNEARQRWNSLFTKTVHRWAHERHGRSEVIDLTPVAGEQLWLVVDADFYDSRMAQSRMALYVRDGDVFVQDGRRLANLIAEEVESFYSVTVRPKPGILDLRRANLLVKKSAEQKKHEEWLAAEARRNLAGAVGKKSGQLSEDECTAALLQTTGEVKELNGHRCPVDSYKPRMFQANGKKCHQVFKVDEVTKDDTNAKPVRPTGACPDGDRTDFTVLEHVQAAIAEPHITNSGAEIRTHVHVGRQGMRADRLSACEDVQKVPDVNISPRTKIKPRSVLGANGISRTGGLPRTIPPWANGLQD
jgi:hypothetical protein